MSKQFFDTALNALKKANKVRKLSLAKKAGYDTVEQYQSFLEGEISKSPEKTAEKEAPKKGVIPGIKMSKAKKSEQLTDLVIAFDTTSSMMSYMQEVKRHVSQLIPTLFKANPNLNISIVAFGDYCDMINTNNFGNAYQVLQPTNNEETLISFVLSAKQTSGGDYAEFYELVIKKINEETKWRNGSQKSVLLIADAVPHEVGYSYSNIISRNQIDWRKEARKANELGIKYDTLRIHGDVEWYKELSELTEGVSLDFKSSSKTNDLIEATVLARGGEATRDAFMSKSMSASVSSDSELNAVYSMYKTVIKK